MNRIILKILIILTIISYVYGYIGANKILNKHFDEKLFLKNQIEKQKTSDRLILEKPYIYYETSSIDSGSAQNEWSGQTCSGTLFNNTLVTSCPNDCYSFWGQGYCDETTSKCECNYFYSGDDCSINFDPEHDWDIMNCHGGRYCPPIYNTNSPRYCRCPTGQEGLECSVCTSNLGCQNLNNNYKDEFTCDNSPYTFFDKTYSCIVTSEEINGDLNNSTASTSFNCKFPNGNYDENNGTCIMDLYYKVHGSPLYFNCSFFDCNRDILPGSNQSITCQRSECNCTSYCGLFLASIIDAVQGPSKFLCSEFTSSEPYFDCSFSQQEISELLPTIPLSCVSGECINTSIMMDSQQIEWLNK